MIDITVTLTPRCASPQASSMPSGPPPITTAVSTLSAAAEMSRASSRLRST
jgi:hypothetical protein